MPTTEHSEQTRLSLINASKAKPQKPFVPGPNPEFAAFVKANSAPYDATTDSYNVKAFDRDLVVDKGAPPKAIYDMHGYWSKKHWAAIREYIRHYLPKKFYPEGTGLVLDCFSGSGMTGVAAMMENRPCVLIDASPAAAFISHCYTHPVDPDDLQAAYYRMMSQEYPGDLRKKLQAITGEDIHNLQQELDWLYASKCDRCGGDATIEYVVYSERFQCPKCGEVVALFDCPEEKVTYLVGTKAKQKTELKKRRVCPHCLKKHGEPHRDFAISTRGKKFGSVPMQVTYECQNGCKPKRGQRLHDDTAGSRKRRFFDECDLTKLKKVERENVPHWYPHNEFLRGSRYHRDALWIYKVDKVSDLYTKRNLWALAAMRAAMERTSVPGTLRLPLTGISLITSRMCRDSCTQTMSGTYYIPQTSKAIRPDSSFSSKVKLTVEANLHLNQRRKSDVTVQNIPSAQCELPEDSLDYIFTDPPYVGKVQYGELNFVWESWLGFSDEWLPGETVVNPYRDKSLDRWDQDIRQVLGNCFKALKPGRWLSLCYHDTDADTWTRIQNILLDTGFEICSVSILDPIQKSKNQTTAEKVVKSDLVLNCRKPRLDEEQVVANTGQLNNISRRVREILVETLSVTAGQPLDKLWDIVLKRLLTRGQMAQHRFDDVLSEVATRSESGRWFLKEEYENLSESDLRNEEDAGRALERFVRLRCIGVPAALSAQLAPSAAVGDQMGEDEVEKHIKREVLVGPAANAFKLAGRLKGCEFYDCLFFYLTRYLKGRAAGRTPRRNLAEFLEEYLVRFRDGDKWLYRPPTDTEAISLKQSRQSGLGRRIRQFVAFLKDEGDFPKERMPDAKTMVAWLKHCANFGLAEAGVTLYEKGGLIGQLNQLSEDDRYDAEDYFSQCRRNAKKDESEDEVESVEEETES